MSELLPLPFFPFPLIISDTSLWMKQIILCRPPFLCVDFKTSAQRQFPNLHRVLLGQSFPNLLCTDRLTRRQLTFQTTVPHSLKKTQFGKSSSFWGQVVTYSKHHLFNGTKYPKEQWKVNNTITIVITFYEGFSVHNFYFSAIHRHKLFNIVSKYVQFRIKKGAGMQVQSPQFC